MSSGVIVGIGLIIGMLIALLVFKIKRRSRDVAPLFGSLRPSIKTKITTTIDLTTLDNEPEAIAKITEALAKVYFDNCLKKGFDIEPIHKAYSAAFNLCPNYRLILQGKPGFDKYKHLKPVFAEITSLPIDSTTTQ